VLAIVLLFNSVSYLLIILKVKLYKAVFVFKVFCITLKDIVLPLSCLNSVIKMLASFILLSISYYLKGGRTYLSFKHTLLLNNSYSLAVDLNGKLL
jgi:hypothetical protein